MVAYGTYAYLEGPLLVASQLAGAVERRIGSGTRVSHTPGATTQNLLEHARVLAVGGIAEGLEIDGCGSRASHRPHQAGSEHWDAPVATAGLTRSGDRPRLSGAP
ncbi:hypothetical protein KZX45_19720 [Georgenia sp. EYE_87]|uniref:hypothetical protein n=1 Tax=Georgenia sp. EYE_87 TaxID=2853448 RepID=UPI002003BEA6|nr:hypothetical protein [Georgenia sp. EYE_87]MCK6212768.1 hypothetical protein [Georgenia sp. EYE_87]